MPSSEPPPPATSISSRRTRAQSHRRRGVDREDGYDDDRADPLNREHRSAWAAPRLPATPRHGRNPSRVECLAIEPSVSISPELAAIAAFACDPAVEPSPTLLHAHTNARSRVANQQAGAEPGFGGP